MQTPVYIAGPVIPYVTRDGRTFGGGGRSENGRSFHSILAGSLSRGRTSRASGSPTFYSSTSSTSRGSDSSGFLAGSAWWSNSPLRRASGPGAFSPSWRRGGGTSPIRPIGPAPAPGGNGRYRLDKLGMIDRAPMAMFGHQGELIVSAITRNEIHETPIWSYSDATGVQKRSTLPELAESGNYGYSFGDGLHLTLESSGGPVDYVAPGPDGPWVRHDYTYLVPHQYKNLQWGYSYRCPVTGREFMGFGNADHPGMMLTLKDGKWQLFSAPEDMRFPTGMGVITRGKNRGTTLISSSFGDTRVHAVDAQGNTRLLRKFPAWGFLRVDQRAGVAYLASETGRVWWASLEDLDTWKECKYKDPGGFVDKIDILGEPNIHPRSGRMIFPTRGEDGVNVYEARRQGGDIVLQRVLSLPGMGEWSVKTAVVGNDFYLGTGQQTGLANDRTPGVLFKLNYV